MTTGRTNIAGKAIHRAQPNQKARQLSSMEDELWRASHAIAEENKSAVNRLICRRFTDDTVRADLAGMLGVA